MITIIPFSGFYNTMHDYQIDRALEYMFSDSSGCKPISQRIANDLWSHTGDIRTEYTSAYVVDFLTMFNEEIKLNIKLEWESVQRPREYNFTTDRVFATVSFADVQRMFQRVDKTILYRVCRDLFTSRPGFISYYSNDWREWGSLKKWDHNQIGTIVAALVVQFFDKEWEWNIIEEWECNGIVSNWVYSALDNEGKRLVKLAEYLRSREERQYRSLTTTNHNQSTL